MNRLVPLKRKIRGLLFWVGAASFAVASVVVGLGTVAREQREYARIMAAQIHVASSLIDDFIRRDLDRIGAILSEGGKQGVRTAFSRILAALAVNRPGDQAYLLDPAGKVVQVPGGFESFLGLDFSHLASVAQNSPVSRVHQSLLNRRSVVSLLFASPDGSRLVVERDLRAIVPLMDQVAGGKTLPGAEMFILATDGTVVYHPDTRLVAARHNLGLELEGLGPFDADGLMAFTLRGRRYIALRESLATPAGWLLYYSFPREVLERAVLYSLGTQALVLIVAFLSLFLALGMVINRYLSAPVAGIVRYLASYRPTEPMAEIPEVEGRGLSETTEIIRAVNAMTTEIHRSATALEAREALFRTVTEFSYHWAFWVGPDRRLQYVTPSCERVTGYSPAELLRSAEPFLDIVHPEDQTLWKAHLNRLGREDDEAFLDFRILTRSGDERWIRHFCRAIINERGEYLGRRGSNIDITEQKGAEQRLLQHASYDTLTGLVNRRLFLERLEQARERQGTDGPAFAVLFMDLDRFKVINDSLGHLVGDRLLQGVAGRLRHEVRPQDTVARLGGDEFAILMEEVGSAADAARFARRISDQVRKPFHLEEREVFSTVSIGIAMSDGDASADLLRNADTAMYRAKSAGPGRVAVFDQRMHEQVMGRMGLEMELPRALDNGEMEVLYQPVLSLEGGACVGFEALLRWRRPGLGLIKPSRFIPVAEDTGLMPALGEWVLRQACRQAAVWRDQAGGGLPLRLHVNLSGAQFEHKGLVALVEECLGENGLDPQGLSLEVTESLIIDHSDEAVRGTFRRLRDLGVDLCLDDFGTGYASMTQLRQFPFSTLKIDRSFVSAMARTGDDRKIVRAIIELAASLGMRVIAEGIEREAERDALRAMGCRYGQGYLFAKPLTAANALAFLRRSQPETVT